MSLSSLLTPRYLRAVAGHLAYGRGALYWNAGQVLSCDVDGDTVVGVVIGGERYHVRMSATGSRLVADCTCPVADEICKHAVALGLAYDAQRGEQHALATPTTPAAPAAVGFATRKDVQRWAEEHHVLHALTLSAEILGARLPSVHQHGVRYLLSGMAVREVASREAMARRMYELSPAVVQAAHDLLEAEAASVADAIAAEQPRTNRPADAAIAPLWDRLVELRRAVRLEAFPRARTNGTWSFDLREPVIVWNEPERLVRPGAYGVPIVTRFTMSGGGEAKLDCACTEARCTHGLALLDATLDALEDPERTDKVRAVAEELLRPGWSRALADLARFEARTSKPAAAVEVWWRIEHELGQLSLAPTVKKQTKRGLSSGATVSVRRMLDEHRAVLSEQDLRVAEYAEAWTPGARSSGTYPVRALLALVGHPRVLTEQSDRAIALQRVQLGFTAFAVADVIRLEPSIDGERISPQKLAQLLEAFSPGEPLISFEPERVLLVEVGDEARQLWAALAKHGDAFPPESHGVLLERLAKLEGRLPLDVPHALKGRELAAETAVVVRLRLLPDVTLELELFVRPGPDAPLFSPGDGPREVLLAREGERGYVRRDLGSEDHRARAALASLPMEGAEEGPPGCFRIADPNVALALVAALPHATALEVEWIDQKQTVSAPVGAKSLRVSIDRKRDWFGIAGELKVEAGRLELAVLLDAARRQQRFVRLDANRWVELSDTLRARLLAIADQTFIARGRQSGETPQLELSPGGASAIRALTEAGAQVATAPDWKQLAQRLANSTELKPRPPAALEAKLRDYQVEGHAWLSRVAAWGGGACLADDMGLGKTVQAIAVLLDRARLGPALVLAPTSVAFNWVAELARFAPTLRPVLYGEQADRAACLGRLRKKDVLIVSYGLLVRDAEPLAKTAFATLVVDEAQALKNPSTHRARAARNLDAGFRIALSGTPFENHLGELWSLFAIIFPGLLGSWDQFRERFAVPIERTKDPEARAALSRVLRPVLLRRTKAEVARELPSRTEIQVPVALSQDEWALYEDARLAAVVELDAQSKKLRNEQQRFAVLAALTRLRLLASHPKLYDPRSKVASSKMRRLLELLEELRSEGHRALVFSQFTSHLALVREELERAKFTSLYLDGSTPAGERGKLIAAFQAGEGDVFLLSLKAGGTGINLTAADYVIHLDPWWNPAVEDQATDRAHRIGQTKPVTVYRLITRGTIEEQILAMHGDKRALVAGILEGSDVAARLTTRDLLALLEAGQRPLEDGDGVQIAK